MFPRSPTLTPAPASATTGPTKSAWSRPEVICHRHRRTCTGIDTITTTITIITTRTSTSGLARKVARREVATSGIVLEGCDRQRLVTSLAGLRLQMLVLLQWSINLTAVLILTAESEMTSEIDKVKT